METCNLKAIQMKTKSAKKHFKDAIKVKCLQSNKIVDVVPDTVHKSKVEGSKYLYMDTTDNDVAMIVDPYDRKIAKIETLKSK